MSEHKDEQKNNLGLIYDLLLSGGAPTALTALVAAAGIGYGAYRLSRAAISKISDYFADKERDLEAQLGEVRRAKDALGDVPVEDDDKSVKADDIGQVGAHLIYR